MDVLKQRHILNLSVKANSLKQSETKVVCESAIMLGLQSFNWVIKKLIKYKQSYFQASTPAAISYFDDYLKAEEIFV